MMPQDAARIQSAEVSGCWQCRFACKAECALNASSVTQAKSDNDPGFASRAQSAAAKNEAMLGSGGGAKGSGGGGHKK